jgi:uncharacterized protein YbaR (Trm112 family)
MIDGNKRVWVVCPKHKTPLEPMWVKSPKVIVQGFGWCQDCTKAYKIEVRE